MKDFHKDRSQLILIAEDNAGDRCLIEEATREIAVSFQLRFVSDGVELLEYLNREEPYQDDGLHPIPNLIILDHHMPRKNGLETLKALKQHEKWNRIPVIAYSTSQNQDVIGKYYQHGVSAYIEKKTELSELLDTIRFIEDFWFRIVNLPNPYSFW
ncbi:MAG: response regulator [Bacteroidota bacterium]